MTSSSLNRRLAEIDRLRGVAIVLTVMTHSWLKNDYFSRLFWDLTAGVDLFFVISGFLITGSLLKLFPAGYSTGSFRQLTKFYVKRFVRIIPPASIVLFFSIVLYPLISIRQTMMLPDFNKVAHDLTAIVFYFINYYEAHETSFTLLAGHYWSLCVEEHYYLLFPWVLIFFKSTQKRLAVTLGLIGLLILILRPYYLKSGAGTRYMLFATHTRYDQLLWGCVLRMLLEEVGQIRSWFVRIANYSKNNLNRGRAFQGYVIGLIVLMAVIPSRVWLDYRYGEVFFFMVGMNLISACSLFLIGLASLDQNVVINVPFLGRLLEVIGARSYSIYLVHLMIVSSPVLKDYVLSNLGIEYAVPFYLFWVGFASELCYRFFEKPFVSLANKAV